MSQLNLSLLGSFQITLDGKPVTGFASSKVEALLAYLAVEADRPHHRDALAELFWPERPEGVGRDSLRQALANLRKAIGDQQAKPPFLRISRAEIQFNSESKHKIDVAAFTEFLKVCNDHTHRRMMTCRPCIHRLWRAVALYQGEFLPHFFLRDSPAFEEWTLAKRESLQRRMLAALKHLVAYHERRREYRQACQFARRQVRLEPWDEVAQRTLMRLLALNGQRSVALAQYRTCCKILADELGLEPTAETTALYEHIRAGDLGRDAEEPRGRGYLTAGPLRSRSLANLQNLPPQNTPFIGRELELLEIEDQLENPACRLLTLVGPGGIGKTRLAWQVAFENIGGYDHGVYFVPLVRVGSPEYLITAIADAIQFTFFGEKDPRSQLLKYLQHKEMLLVMDNFEHLLTSPDGETQGGTNLISETLKVASGLKLLVTSRERLKLQGEWAYDIQGMQYPLDETLIRDLESYSAVQLFMACARRAQSNFSLGASDLAEVLRICRIVDGNPLGIELAAAWVPTLSLTEIAAEIEGGFDLLATPLRDVSQRHRSLRAVFEHSWKLLTEAEQAAFKRMSVFQGGFLRTAAKQVTGATLPILSSLVDKSLLKHTAAGRYEIHDLLRQFCLEKLGQEIGAEEHTRDCHCRYYANLLKGRETDIDRRRDKEAIKEIEREIDNVWAGWQWAIARRHEDALENYLKSLTLFHEIRGWYQEGVRALEKAAEVLRGIEPTDSKSILLGKVLIRQGHLCILFSLFERGKALVEESLAIFRQDRDGCQEEVAYAYYVLASLAIHRGAPAEAEPYLQKSLTIYKQLGNQHRYMMSLSQLGWAESKQGKIEPATRHLHESLEFFREKGPRYFIPWTLKNLSRVDLGFGQYTEAVQHLRESVVISQEIGVNVGIARSLELLGWTFLDLGEYEQSRECYQESLAIYKTLGHPRGIGWNLSMIGYIAILEGEWAEAAAYLQDSLTFSRETDFETEAWWYHCIQGELALLQETYPLAKEHFRKSQTLFEDVDDILPWGVAWSLKGLGRTACAVGAYKESRDYFQQALSAAMGVLSIPEALDILGEMAALLAKQEKKEQAVELLAIPLHDSASRQITKDCAARFLTELEGELPPEVVAAALARGRKAGFEKIVATLLGAKSLNLEP